MISALQVMLGFLDLLGVALVGVLGALSITGIQSIEAGNRVTTVLNFLNLENLSFQSQVSVIGFSAILVLSVRTIFSVYFMRRTYYYLGIKSAFITGKTSSKLFARDLLNLNQYSSQEILYSLTIGVNSITHGIIGSIISAISDASLLILILIGLFVADFSMGVSVLILFSITGGAIYLLQQKRAKKLGKDLSSLSIKSEEKIQEAVSSFREIKVHNRHQFYSLKIEEIRNSLAKVQAEINFMPQISKYVFEGALLTGTLLIAGLQFYLKDAANAFGSLAIFMAASSRVAPAVLRLQQGMVLIKTSVGTSESTLNLVEDLFSDSHVGELGLLPDFVYEGFTGDVAIFDLCFKYDNGSSFAMNNLNLEIKTGSHVAIVGPSGSGKTTLADILLGVINPDSGKVMISGMTPRAVIKKWPGAISYVPQNTVIFNSSAEENIALGYQVEEINHERVKEAIAKTDLTDFVNNLSNSLSSRLGEQGGALSGGQRQRIGIARAFYTNPKLLILDEATSALDSDTELVITNSLKQLQKGTTVITIAHRLSTVKDADLVVYMEKGNIIATGSFQEVRERVKNFDRQANLMGLVTDTKNAQPNGS